MPSKYMHVIDFGVSPVTGRQWRSLCDTLVWRDDHERDEKAGRDVDCPRCLTLIGEAPEAAPLIEYAIRFRAPAGAVPLAALAAAVGKYLADRLHLPADRATVIGVDQIGTPQTDTAGNYTGRRACLACTMASSHGHGEPVTHGKDEPCPMEHPTDTIRPPDTAPAADDRWGF